MLKIENVIICHGSLNKFVMINEIENPLLISKEERKNLSMKLCSKEIFDADGILFVQKESKFNCIGKMSMFNADGGEAEMCGNGIRCVARFISEKFNIDNFYIETKNDKIKISKENNIFENIPTYNALIQPVSLKISSLPMKNTEGDEFINKKHPEFNISEFSAISVQNPHIVFIQDEIDIKKVVSYEKIINSNYSIFPNQVNLNFVKILDKNSIFVITNERGSGITPSCGTGMSSSTYITCKLGYCEFNTKINVYNNGGKVICIADNKKGTINLIGNATYTHLYEVEIDERFDLKINQIKVFDDEILSYSKFLTICKKIFTASIQ